MNEAERSQSSNRAERLSSRSEWTVRLIAAGVLVFVGVVLSALAAQSEPRPFRPLDALGYALLIVASGSVAAPRRWAQPAFIVALGTTTTYMGLHYPTHAPFFVGVFAAAYVAANPSSRGRTVLLGAATVVAFAVLSAISSVGGALVGLGLATFICLTLAIGQVIAEQRAATERSLQEARSAEAERMLADERLRIARELHDVISHGIAMINVQAGVAAHVIEERPEEAKAALLEIKTASRDALRDLRGILGLLRDTDSGDPLAPMPGTADLPNLLANVRKSGVEVEANLPDVDGLPASIDLAAYRVVQEALTNVIRHAPGAKARVSIDRAADSLTVLVENEAAAIAPVAGESRKGTGHGLIGIRERVRAAGGQVQSGSRPDGGYYVLATFPLEDGA